MVTTFSYKPIFGEYLCTQFRVIVVTDPQTHPQTGPITIHCAAASAQHNKADCVTRVLWPKTTAQICKSTGLKSEQIN